MNTPYKYERTETVEELISEYSSIPDGTGSGVHVSIAGRIMQRRDQGKVVFGNLQDSSGRIQLLLLKVNTKLEAFSALNIGDWIGVKGEVMKTKRRTLSKS